MYKVAPPISLLTFTQQHKNDPKYTACTTKAFNWEGVRPAKSVTSFKLCSFYQLKKKTETQILCVTLAVHVSDNINELSTHFWNVFY